VCGAFAGWWTVDDFCANQNNVVGPFNCGTPITDILSQYWPTSATSTCNGNNNTTWASEIQPFLVNLQRACPTAYSYPYDDPTSTFQCRSDRPINRLGYNVIFRDLAKPPK
jgi:hypothetical protein